MKDNEVLVLMAFSENYSFELQDENHHWNHDGCTLHPVVLYFKITEHWVVYRYASFPMTCYTMLEWCGKFKKKSSNLSKLDSRIEKVEYFTDGCAANTKTANRF
jgi:hypothetical protein